MRVGDARVLGLGVRQMQLAGLLLMEGALTDHAACPGARAPANSGSAAATGVEGMWRLCRRCPWDVNRGLWRSNRRGANASTSSSDGPRRPAQELSATQATFLAGAAVTHAHHASGVALQAAQAARDSQLRERQVVGQASLFGNVLRHEARHVVDAARQAVSQAQQSEQAARAQARSAVQTLRQAASAAVSQAQQSEQALRAEAETAVSAIQQQANERIALLDREVAQGKGTVDRLTDLLAESNQRRFQAEDMNRALAAQMQELQRQFQLFKESQEAATLHSPETVRVEPSAFSEGQTPHCLAWSSSLIPASMLRFFPQ